MRLTTLSDYALRLLMYAAAQDRLFTIEEAAGAYGISRAHLMKVANRLTRTGYLKAARGRSGGLTLGKPANEINLGAVVRVTEPDFALVECFMTGNQCIISKRCKLPNVLNQALANFIATFDQFTLADLTLEEQDFAPVRQYQKLRGPSIDYSRCDVSLPRGRVR